MFPADTLSRKCIQYKRSLRTTTPSKTSTFKSTASSTTCLSPTRRCSSCDRPQQKTPRCRNYSQPYWMDGQNCKPTISEFWNFRDQLSAINGIILKGEKILVPTSLRSEMIQKIHSSHLGIEKTKQKAREILYWPGLATQIHNAVAACPICTPTRPSNPKQPLTTHEIRSRPWQKLATDLFTWNERSFVVTVDFSKLTS